MFTWVCASSRSLLMPTGSLDPQLDPKISKRFAEGLWPDQEPRSIQQQEQPYRPKEQYKNKLLKVFIYLHFLQLTCCLEIASSV